MPIPPDDSVALEAASFSLDRAAHPQFQKLLDAMRMEREKAVRVMVHTTSTEATMTAKGVVQAYDDLIYRMNAAETTLAKAESRKQAEKDRAR